ncbi:Putative nucleoside-diphosphate sugar epimerase [Rheinheimera sp. A13L]|uniref:NAD(P)H-binding protein n=1 Tax=Rheinheimera sp. A13L TaxID=506534 RepID=UPI00021254EC|nr:NAD(P)H-binding protein [Rheinheimera sp. A13L]EGM77245.1 Putative nucleoside-diphosphate sugar epimerase [Rheinheimera sp. A13L]
MILVTGATGTTGSAVVRQLNKVGIRPRIMVRDPQKAQRYLPDALVELVQGDYADAASVKAALTGISAAYLVSNEDPQFEVQLDQFIRIAEQVGLNKLVVLSALADPQSDISFVRLHGQYEQRICQSALNFSIIYPDWFMQNFLGHIQAGQWVFPGGPGLVSFIDVRDVAAFAAKLLQDPTGYHQSCMRITGPQAMTFAQAADKINTMLAGSQCRPFRFIQPTADEYRSMMLQRGASASSLEMFIGMTSLSRNGVNYPPTPVFADVMGYQPCSFEQFIQQHMDYIRHWLKS